MKKAIVIGATAGIGNELAKILVQKGYKAGITGRRNSALENLKNTKSEKYVISSFDCTAENN